MPLTIPFDPTGLSPAVANALDELITGLQTWAGRVEGLGRFVDVAYDSSAFRATTGTWTVSSGDQVWAKYALVQDMLIFLLALTATTTSAGMGSALRILVPGGYSLAPPSTAYLGGAAWASSGAEGLARVYPSTDARWLQLVRDNALTAWPSGETNTVALSFAVICPILPR